MNVGSLAADMIDFVNLVYGDVGGLWMAYIPDAGDLAAGLL